MNKYKYKIQIVEYFLNLEFYCNDVVGNRFLDHERADLTPIAGNYGSHKEESTTVIFYFINSRSWGR